MSYLRYLCLFAYSGVKHILHCVFVLFMFVLLPVSVDCPQLVFGILKRLFTVKERDFNYIYIDDFPIKK